MIKPTATPCQTRFAQAEYAGKKKQTRRDLFLAQMQTVVPWARLIAVIEPHYPKSGYSRRRWLCAGSWQTRASALGDRTHAAHVYRTRLGIEQAIC